MKLRTLAANCLLLCATSALAAEYYVVVPVKGRTTTAPAESIAVSLQAATLPASMVGQAYSYNLRDHLLVTGDKALDLNQAMLTTADALPAGLSLAGNGVISGTPNAISDLFFQVTATYKAKTTSQTYRLVTQDPPKNISQHTGYRAWSDGTVALSCNHYLQGKPGYHYSGATGSGVYRIKPVGQAETDVYCDMTQDGGGWTLVLKGVSKQLSGWNTTTALNTLALQSPAFVGGSGKFSDVFINATKTSAYRLQGSSYFPVIPTRYVPASCVYAHTTGASGTCATTYADLTMSAGAATQTAVRGGISDYRSSGEYLTFITNADGNWYVGTNQASQYEGGNGHTPVNGLQAGSSILMWVR